MLGWILSQTDFWRSRAHLRVCTFVESEAQVSHERTRMQAILGKIRISADLMIAVLERDSPLFLQTTHASPVVSHMSVFSRNEVINQVIRRHSSDTGNVLYVSSLTTHSCTLWRFSCGICHHRCASSAQRSQ